MTRSRFKVYGRSILHQAALRLAAAKTPDEATAVQLEAASMGVPGHTLNKVRKLVQRRLDAIEAARLAERPRIVLP